MEKAQYPHQTLKSAAAHPFIHMTKHQGVRHGGAASPLLISTQYVDALGSQISLREHQDKKTALFLPGKPSVMLTTESKRFSTDTRI